MPWQMSRLRLQVRRRRVRPSIPGFSHAQRRTRDRRADRKAGGSVPCAAATPRWRYRGRCPQARRMSAREAWTSEAWTSEPRTLEPWLLEPWPSTIFNHRGFADVVQVGFRLRLVFLGEHLFPDFALLWRIDLGRFPVAEGHHLHTLLGDLGRG